MKRMVPLLLMAAMISFLPAAAPGDAVLVPYVFEESFESGSVGPWSSYPPSQDTAYDPTIWVKPLKVEQADNRALYREITPNYEIDYIFGVRRKVRMYVDSSGTLTFRSYIKSNREIEGVLVKFGFADGVSAEKMISFSSRQTWRDCSVRLADVLPDGGMRKLDAVAFMAVCPSADPENLLRFGIDDVRLNGMRGAEWRFTAPAVHDLDEWDDAIAGRHFAEGGKITIAGNPPFLAGSVAVTIARALTGGDEKHFRMKRSRSTGEWSVTIPLNGRSGVTAGLWRATVQASSEEKKDDSITSSVVFLVRRKDAPAENPRLLMAPCEAAKLRVTALSGRMKKILERLESSARNYRERNDYNDFNYNLDAYDDVYWLPTYGGYINAIGTPSGYIRANGLVYGVTGDQEAGDAAKNALLKMADWPSYVHPHILNQGQFTYWPVGQKLADMAVGFDMTADRFTDAGRKKVARALYSKGVTEVFKEYVRDNRVSSFTSNWIGDVTGGGIMCALAVMNDYPDKELEPYLTGMILKMNSLIMNCFDEDGGYGEGFSYLNHAMHCMNVAIPALDRMYGVRFPGKMYRCLEFVLYLWDSGANTLFDYGDTSSGVGNLSGFTHVITKTGDPFYKWIYDIRPGSGDTDLFQMDDGIPSRSPDGAKPTVKLFRDVGTAVFRSGFGHDDFTFVFRCGPFYNHQHFDQGSFWLADRGETFLREVGRSDYYDDPWYKKLVIQSGGHNCVLVNDNAESQRAGDFLRDVPAWSDYAEITDFLAFDGGGFASGRLDELYKGALEYLRRSVLYVEPRTVVLIDEIIGSPETETVNLRFPAPYRDDITIDGREARIARPSGVLTIFTAAPGKSASPSGYTTEIRKRPLTLYEFRGENAITMKARGFLQLNAGLGDGEGATFVNVMS
ncbi:MAG: heparinase II/III-family protein, partial [Candidatus Latescibacteria bacterium]|nr:heparinase II/III-family protein [Candidatus Latescibacterota bacterium]